MLSLTHRNLDSLQIFHKWSLAVLYESTSLLSDVIKIKASKIAPDEPVLKVSLKILHKVYNNVERNRN